MYTHICLPISLSLSNVITYMFLHPTFAVSQASAPMRHMSNRQLAPVGGRTLPECGDISSSTRRRDKSRSGRLALMGDAGSRLLELLSDSTSPRRCRDFSP